MSRLSRLFGSDMPDDPLLRRLRRAAVIGVIYGTGRMIILFWLLLNGIYVHAIGWYLLTRSVWNRIATPLLGVDGWAIPEVH
jgi:hypothetical protein